MTDKEKKLEEIRLLNLRVDELKSQNNHYGDETEDLVKKLEGYKVEVKEFRETSSSFKAEIKRRKEKIKELAQKESEYEIALGNLRLSVQEAEQKLEMARGETEALRRTADELEAKAEEATLRLQESTAAAEVKFTSLRGFEEQLLIKEALLRRREESLDLNEKGVNLSEILNEST